MDFTIFYLHGRRTNMPRIKIITNREYIIPVTWFVFAVLLTFAYCRSIRPGPEIRGRRWSLPTVINARFTLCIVQCCIQGTGGEFKTEPPVFERKINRNWWSFTEKIRHISVTVVLYIIVESPMYPIVSIWYYFCLTTCRWDAVGCLQR